MLYLQPALVADLVLSGVVPRFNVRYGGTAAFYEFNCTAVETEVDRDQRPGRFVLTGSENLVLSERVSQSLAGRCLV